jgi:hypothetical protein
MICANIGGRPTGASIAPTARVAYKLPKRHVPVAVSVELCRFSRRHIFLCGARRPCRGVHHDRLRRDWVLRGFHWVSWARSEYALALCRDPSALERAEPMQLLYLITALIRQDRFSEGVLLNAFRGGLILSIVRRAAMWDRSAWILSLWTSRQQTPI